MFICSLVWFYRIRRKALLHLEYKYELKNLRNELRWRGITGELNSKNWVFGYLDNTLLAASNNLKYYNIYSAFGLGLLHRKDKRFNAFKTHYKEEVGSDGNKSFEEIDNKFAGLVLNYVLNKHMTFRFLGLGIIIAKSTRKQEIKEEIGDLRLYPETTT